VTDTRDDLERTIPSMTVVIAAVVIAALLLIYVTGHWRPAANALITAVAEGGLALFIFVAAAGFGRPLIRWVAPADTSPGLITATGCGLGLWGLSTLVLAVGSIGGGLLSGWVLWPVVAAGLGLAAWQIRQSGLQFTWPQRVPGGALLWVLVAAVGALWLSAATCPPGLPGLGDDSHSVLARHLQLPRDYLDAGRIHATEHNVYGFFPGGVDMLYLLAMVLRGGAYAGGYAAKFVHGLFGVLAVVAVMTAWPGRDQGRGRLSGVLLASTPFVIYLSWLALADLAAICYLTLALLWLRQWGNRPSLAAACLIGAVIGAACSTGYRAALFVAAPTLGAMVLSSLLTVGKFRAIWQIAPATLMAVVLLAPWPARNAALTGNPLFPLATQQLGRGHWSAESQQRWIDAHAPEAGQPVPRPADWEPPPRPGRLKMVFTNFIGVEMFGRIGMVLAAIALCVLVATRGRTDPWDWALVSVCAAQVAAWILLTHQMPPQALAPIVAPLALLGGGLLDRVSRMAGNPFNPSSTAEAKPWGAPAAGIVFVIAVTVNIFTAAGAGRFVARGLGWNGLPTQAVADARLIFFGLDADDRPMLVGETQAFYMPAGAVYATAFDTHPLADMIQRGLSPPQALAELKALGVTHIIVNWPDVVRLADTCGYPAVLAEQPLASYEGVWPTGRFREEPRLAFLDDLVAQGAQKRRPPSIEPSPTTAPADDPEAADARRQLEMTFSIYVMPWAVTAPSTAPADELVGPPAEQ